MLKVVPVWYVPEFKLYSKVAPVGLVTVILPVLVVQVGCVSVAAGVAGAPGTGFTVTLADTVPDRATAAQDIARKFSIELDDQYQTAIEGFAIRTAPPDVIAALRCDPRMLL